MADYFADIVEGDEDFSFAADSNSGGDPFVGLDQEDEWQVETDPGIATARTADSDELTSGGADGFRSEEAGFDDDGMQTAWTGSQPNYRRRAFASGILLLASITTLALGINGLPPGAIAAILASL